jgi:hypothetical protein
MQVQSLRCRCGQGEDCPLASQIGLERHRSLRLPATGKHHDTLEHPERAGASL